MTKRNFFRTSEGYAKELAKNRIRNKKRRKIQRQKNLLNLMESLDRDYSKIPKLAEVLAAMVASEKKEGE